MFLLFSTIPSTQRIHNDRVSRSHVHLLQSSTDNQVLDLQKAVLVQVLQHLDPR